ncbi:FtsW/RodA/SpoVE family cell cycle protein [uncultured Thiodictyon sp.]|uniref:FtsW/RodA/SpoVE family cell cycle protein n=1 Tax=uncultured Thiodictyon sp. TaxID=1846217 RepID=UPI0025F8A8FD|nr:FtsW/RodA/SpoVE family cell cycle protein [uncultured Thiodictyon sp.]
MSAPLNGSRAGFAASWERRHGERELLLSCIGCMALGFVLILGADAADGRHLAATDLLPLVLYALCLVAVHLTLVLTGFRGDQVLTATVAGLAGFGLLAQVRMGGFQGDSGALTPWLVPAGLCVMTAGALIFANGRYRVLARGLWLWAALSLLLVVALLVTGQRFRGAVYALGFTTPTEALKITVVLGLATYLERHGQALARWHAGLPPWRALWPLLAFWAVLTGLLALQRDLGMVMILGVALLAVLVSATGRIGYLVYGLLAAVGLGSLLLMFFAHGQRRIDTWLDPFQDPTGEGWQILQGLSGMYAGGLWGEGFGIGSPEYTPIAAADFIYSVIGEELGFLGCVVVVLFFLVLFQRGIALAGQARSPFGRLLAGGLTAVLAVQTLLNIGGVTKSIPLTGTTLPFISHGGASLLTAFGAIALLLAISDGEPGRADKPPRATRSRATVGVPSPGQPRKVRRKVVPPAPNLPGD